MKYAMWILRYLSHTESYALMYFGTSNAGLIRYSDSDWAETEMTDARHLHTCF